MAHPRKPRLSWILVVVLVLDFFGRGKHADCQQRSKIENEDDDEDEDDWGSTRYRANR
jgi:hypothetical protein